MSRTLGMKPLEARRSLVDDVALRIEEEVVAGRFGQGERLTEASIAEQLQVSRGTVREAFKLLCGQGLLEQVPRRGIYVRSLSGADVRELYELRAALEAGAAAILTRSHAEADVKVLQRALARLETAAGRNDAKELHSADLAFHESVCRLAGNKHIHSVFVQYTAILYALFELKLDETPLEVVESHRALLEAIEAGDPAVAASLFQHHVAEAAELASAHIDGMAAEHVRADGVGV